jgi:hypothetical protein
VDIGWGDVELGWQVRTEDGDDDHKEPDRAFTVGLSRFGHPELVIFGLRPSHAARVLDEVGEQVRSGAVLRGGDPAYAESINPHKLRVFAAGDGLQLVWADPNGTFPWEPGFRNPQWLQPIPDPLPVPATRRLHEVA